MEKYQKLLNFIILFAFFIATNFYIQKASEVLDAFIANGYGGQDWHYQLSKSLFSWIIS